MLAVLVQHLKDPALGRRKRDLPQCYPVDGALPAVEIADLEIARAEGAVVPDAGQQFVDGLHGGYSKSPVTRGWMRRARAECPRRPVPFAAAPPVVFSRYVIPRPGAVSLSACVSVCGALSTQSLTTREILMNLLKTGSTDDKSALRMRRANLCVCIARAGSF